MSTFMALLAVLLPIAAIIFFPKWMKKNGKGKNTIVRIIAGLGCAIVLLIIFALLSRAFMTDAERAANDETIRVNDSIRNAKIVIDEDEAIAYPRNPNFEQFAYWKRGKKGDFNYRIFVYITDASPKDMEKHAKKQMWSKQGTTMVCYFRSSEGLNSNAITLAKDVDKAIDEIWKPTLIARYMHWPTGKEEFTENPYVE
jgi:hypothetical protein